MDNEYYLNTITGDSDEMKKTKVPVTPHMTSIKFQKEILNAKSLRGKLAICFSKLSESGVFSDQSSEVWKLRQEVSEHLPEHLRG